jgi:hypothetical protein
MTSKPPPVPPASRSRKSPGKQAAAPRDDAAQKQPPENLAEQDRQGNIKQNTTNQRYQQDR